jgi:AraC-like DNA-binding protein
MARFGDLVRGQPEGALDMSQLRAALGVSERWLRWCCEQHLGMGPITYIRLHRMQSAHQALRHGGPRTLRVSDVATRFGFRSLGRFASAYRERYGELPSETLRGGSHRGMPVISFRTPSSRPGRRDLR